jgi:hypothetical protein
VGQRVEGIERGEQRVGVGARGAAAHEPRGVREHRRDLVWPLAIHACEKRTSTGGAGETSTDRGVASSFGGIGEGDLTRSPLRLRAEGVTSMESSAPARVLIVAHRTAATPALQEAVRARAEAGPAVFTLLVPVAPHGLHKVVNPEDADREEAGMILELALPLLEAAAGSPIEGVIGDSNPVDAVSDVVNLRGADEIIISTLPVRVSRWLRADLPSKLTGLGLPVTTVTAQGTTKPIPKRASRDVEGAA